MLSFILTSVLACSSASASPVSQPSIRACMDTCTAFNDAPGPELLKCVAACQSQVDSRSNGKLFSTPVDDNGDGWCETYEEDCERDNDPIF